jgi:hypothetical protein
MIITHGNEEQQHLTMRSQRAIATHGNNEQQCTTMRSPRVATTHSNDEKEQSSIFFLKKNQNIIKQMKTLNTKIPMRIVFTQ